MRNSVILFICLLCYITSFSQSVIPVPLEMSMKSKGEIVLSSSTVIKYDKALKNSDKMKAKLNELKAKYNFIGDIRGLGYMLAIEFVGKDKSYNKDKCDAFLAAALENGLILINCGPNGNIVRILPPVTSTDAEIEEGLRLIEKSLQKIA